MQIRTSLSILAISCALGAQRAEAQVFVNNTTSIPQGGPFNNSETEQVDFADVDLDGDFDAAFADGGDCCNDQNRLWINLGGAQLGTIGTFADETAARFPVILDDSRDVEFADFDGDGDPDLHIANTTQISNQSNRWWTNQGGLQGGSAGFYVDETALRWIGLGEPGSSVSPSMLLPGGGFIDWGHDADYADFDADGDLDLVTASVGGSFSGNVPSRVWLNDGLGFYTEFNPSGFQLTGTSLLNGSPGLWAEGLQQHETSNTTGAFCDVATIAIDVDMADVDGDLDLDTLLLDRMQTPRMFRNRLEETGALAFRDATGATWPDGYGGGSGKYEEELGDLDGDLDVDVYGLNWKSPYQDLTLRNDGGGVFGEPTAIVGTLADGEDGDLVDYDADGDLDLFVAPFSGTAGLFRNDTVTMGPITFTEQPGAVAGVTGLPLLRDIDIADVDADGDYDAFTGGDGPNLFLEDVLGAQDTTAPVLALFEQAPDRVSSPVPTVVRAQVYDDAPDYMTALNPTALEYRIDGGPWYGVSARWSGGQVFRAAIPGQAIGTIEYRLSSEDLYGNATTSATLSYVASDGGCNGALATYCTAKPTSILGCLPSIQFNGTPAASAGSGFLVSAGPVPGGNPGLFVYSTNASGAPLSTPYGFLCVAPGSGMFRIALQGGGGTPGVCNGSYAVDFNQQVATQTQDPALVAGAQVEIQVWYRDPPNPGTANLTNAGRFVLCP